MTSKWTFAPNLRNFPQSLLYCAHENATDRRRARKLKKIRFRPRLFFGMEAYKIIVTDVTTWLHVLWLSVKETSEQPNKDWTNWKCYKPEKPDNILIKREKSDQIHLFLCSEIVSYRIMPVYRFIYRVHYEEGNLWLKLFRNQSSKLFFCLDNEVFLHCINQNRRRFKKKKKKKKT